MKKLILLLILSPLAYNDNIDNIKSIKNDEKDLIHIEFGNVKDKCIGLIKKFIISKRANNKIAYNRYKKMIIICNK